MLNIHFGWGLARLFGGEKVHGKARTYGNWKHEDGFVKGRGLNRIGRIIFVYIKFNI
jgi:hypothetical protein